MMYSSKACISSWVLFICLLSLTAGFSDTINETDLQPGEPADSSNIRDASITLPPANITDAPNTNHSTEPPTYVVKSVTGRPCLLATFNVTIRVSYYVIAAKSERKYVAFKDVRVPNIEDAVNDGVCGENETSLILEWGNSTFNLNLTFTSHGESQDSVHTNWTLDSIALSYNLSNLIVFPGSIGDDYQTIRKDDLGLFNTAIGHTKECDKPTKTKLGKGDTGSIIKFEYVKLAAFNLTSETFPKETEECPVNSSSLRDEDIMVPLIIACALSFVIIVVVVAYAISRKVQEVRDQSQYKPMP